jgi:hypothetical protein
LSTPFPIIRAEGLAAARETRGEAAPLLKARWAAARVGFIAYAGFALFSVVGGILTAPLATYYMFGDWRFWRHWRPAVRLLGQGWRMLGLMARGEGGFMLSVPLASPPRSAPNPRLAEVNSAWAHGASCGPCSRCCAKIHCPILDPRTGFCRGYDGFFWRYFNCGRFPSHQHEIDYYECPKWLIRHR